MVLVFHLPAAHLKQKVAGGSLTGWEDGHEVHFNEIVCVLAIILNEITKGHRSQNGGATRLCERTSWTYQAGVLSLPRLCRNFPGSHSNCCNSIGILLDITSFGGSLRTMRISCWTWIARIISVLHRELDLHPSHIIYTRDMSRDISWSTSKWRSSV